MSKGITKEYNNALVYIRNWNLLKYDCGILAKYGLEQKDYWYIGSTIEGFSTRTEKFILQMTSNNPSYEKYMNNNTRIFITKLMKFYKEELNKNDEEINELVFWKHHSEIEVPYKKYVFKKEILKSKYDKCVTFHEMLETKTINQYMYKQLLNSKNEVLNEGDNGVKEITKREYYEELYNSKKIDKEDYDILINNTSDKDKLIKVRVGVNTVSLNPISRKIGNIIEIEDELEKIVKVLEKEVEYRIKEGQIRDVEQ